MTCAKLIVGSEDLVGKFRRPREALIIEFLGILGRRTGGWTSWRRERFLWRRGLRERRERFLWRRGLRERRERFLWRRGLRERRERFLWRRGLRERRERLLWRRGLR